MLKIENASVFRIKAIKENSLYMRIERVVYFMKVTPKSESTIKCIHCFPDYPGFSIYI
jgi:hypothetical protein